MTENKMCSLMVSFVGGVSNQIKICHIILGVGFKDVLLSSLFGEDEPNLTSIIFSDGLKS